MNTRTKTIIILILVVLAAALAFWRFKTYSPVSIQPITTVSYSCSAGKSITAAYYQGESKPAPSEGQPPIPGGSVALTFSDGRVAMTLAQTISADGARYANADESFIFWSKGNGVLVLENNAEKSYVGCIAVAPESSGLPQVYSNSIKGFSIRLPVGYSIDESYKYQELGPKKDISGVKFTIATSTAAGTNLGSDSYVSVEQIAKVNSSAHPDGTVGAGGCTASLFLDKGAVVSTIIDGGTSYSVASSTGAGAGNRYEETVFALSGTSASWRTCTAIRYFIHYSVIENYPAGVVHEFDKQALRNQFDAIRRALITI